MSVFARLRLELSARQAVMRTALRTARSRLTVSPTMYCQTRITVPTHCMVAQTAGLGYDAPRMILSSDFDLPEIAELDSDCANDRLDHFLSD